MIAVVFEVYLKSDYKKDYFTLATALKLALTEIDGFISVERFQSINDPDKYLSLSFWRDEQAVKTWRNTDQHRQAQQAGRSDIFTDYRIRVAEITRDYTMNNPEQAPTDSQKKHHQ